MARCASLTFLYLLVALFVHESSCNNITLNIDQTHRTTIRPLQNYTINVNAATAWYRGNYSAFTIQVHTQKYNVTLRNGSSNCTNMRLCSTTGTSVGFVEVLLTQGWFSYVASIASCGGNSTGCGGVANVTILIAVVGVHSMNPIPGGCAQTSALEYEAAITPTYNSQSTTIHFQDSDVGFVASTQLLPACDTSARVMQRLEYHIYRQCISAGDLRDSILLDTIQSMLDPIAASSQVYTKLKYSDPKKVLFDSISGRGIVYNIVVKDTTSGKTSPYIPVSTYSCDFISGDCERGIPLSSYILGPLLGIIGLFLCYLAHRFFHVEVFLLSTLIAFFLIYLTLSASTQWNDDLILGSSVGISLFISILIFVFWFFTGYYYIFVILFGLAMGSLVSATLLFTPLGSMIALLKLNYIYILAFLCVAVICIVPLVAFPVVLNTVSSSVIGSYSVVFCISLFRYTQLQDILVRVVKNASISGFLSAYSGCTFDTIDIVCCCVWILLAITGVAVQVTIHLIQKRRYKKKQERLVAAYPQYGLQNFKKYSGFPETSLYRRLTRKHKFTAVSQPRRNKDESTRPLLSPNTSPSRVINYGTYTSGNT